VLATAEDLEDELVALVAVLAREHLDPLEGGGLQRAEAVALEDVPDGREGALTTPELRREKVPRARRRLHRVRRLHARPSWRLTTTTGNTACHSLGPKNGVERVNRRVGGLETGDPLVEGVRLLLRLGGVRAQRLALVRVGGGVGAGGPDLRVGPVAGGGLFGGGELVADVARRPGLFPFQGADSYPQPPVGEGGFLSAAVGQRQRGVGGAPDGVLLHQALGCAGWARPKPGRKKAEKYLLVAATEHVPSLSGPLATLPGVSRIRLPPASLRCCDSAAVQVFHLHSVTQRLVALQVPLPVPGHRPGVGLGGSLVDVAWLADPRRRRWAPPAAAGLAPGPQADQLAGQAGHRLGVDPLVDRLVRHPASLVLGVVGGQPARDRPG